MCACIVCIYISIVLDKLLSLSTRKKQCSTLKTVEEKKAPGCCYYQSRSSCTDTKNTTRQTTEHRYKHKTVTTRARVHLPVKQYKRVSGHQQDRSHSKSRPLTPTKYRSEPQESWKNLQWHIVHGTLTDVPLNHILRRDTVIHKNIRIWWPYTSGLLSNKMNRCISWRRITNGD